MALRHTETPEWPMARVDRMLELAKQGLSCKQIAAAMNDGATRNAIIGKLRRWGVDNISGLRTAQIRVPRGKRETQGARISLAPHIKPPRPLEPPLAIVSPKSAHWLQRLSGQCAWPVSGSGADTFSCCRPVVDDRPYCAKHCALGYTPVNGGRELLRSARRCL